MRGKRAKQFRREAYGELSTQGKRKYRITDKGSWVLHQNLRTAYQKMKKDWKDAKNKG